jgi:hypothetical protein
VALGGQSLAVTAASIEDATRMALRDLLRGGSWQALSQEIAWEAVRASGAGRDSLSPIRSLIDARLSAHVDALQQAVEQAALAAVREHARSWPHDYFGGQIAARLEGSAEARRLLAAAYLEILAWAVQVLEARLERSRCRSWWGLPIRPRRRSAEAQVRELRVPAFVGDHLLAEDRFGWSARSAA